MTLSALRVPIVGGLFLGATVVVRIAAWPLVGVELPERSTSASVNAVSQPTALLGSESLTVIVQRDPFRIARRPAPVAYDPLRLAEQLAPPLPAPRPTLGLVGLVDGADPSAVIEGLPGVEGPRIVRAGDVVAGLRVRQIGRNRVVIAGMDTTWVLEVREPWKN